MYITLRMSNGKKITGQMGNLIFFSASNGDSFVTAEGKITINLDHVLYIRPATEEEIAHAQIHGW